jgi:hypothetical protein
LSASYRGGLAADREPGADLCPGVATGAQALDGLGHHGVDLRGQADQEDECFHIAVFDAAAVGVQDAPDECPGLVALDGPPSPVLVSTSP